MATPALATESLRQSSARTAPASGRDAGAAHHAPASGRAPQARCGSRDAHASVSRPGCRVLEIRCETPEIRAHALVEEITHEALDRGIAQDRRNRDMKLAIECGSLRRSDCRALLTCAQSSRSSAGKIRVRLDPRRRFRRNRTLDEGTCAEQVRTAPPPRSRLATGSGRHVGHIDPGTDPDANAPLDLQRDERLADRRAGDIQLLRKLTLGGKARPPGDVTPESI